MPFSTVPGGTIPGISMDSLKQELEAASGRPVLCISAAMGTNLDQLLAETWAELGV